MNRRGSLLVVDDSESNRDALSRRLAQKGFLVETAADGARRAGVRGDRPVTISSCSTSRCPA